MFKNSNLDVVRLKRKFTRTARFLLLIADCIVSGDYKLQQIKENLQRRVDIIKAGNVKMLEEAINSSNGFGGYFDSSSRYLFEIDKKIKNSKRVRKYAKNDAEKSSK